MEPPNRTCISKSLDAVHEPSGYMLKHEPPSRTDSGTQVIDLGFSVIATPYQTPTAFPNTGRQSMGLPASILTIIITAANRWKQ
jgi:hypothetical protein